MRRPLYLGLGIFAALLIYVLLTQTGDRGYNTLVLPRLTKLQADQFSRIDLVRSDGKIVLARLDKQWHVVEPFTFAADTYRVDTLRRALAETRITDLIAEAPGREADYGLNSATAVHVMVNGLQGQTLDLLVGKTNSSGSHTFVRLPNRTAVYLAIGDLASALSGTAADWRSLKITDVAPEDIRRVAWERGRTALILEKSVEAQPGIVRNIPSGVTPSALPSRVLWKVAGQTQTLNESKVGNLLGALAHLNASRFGTLPAKPEKPSAIIRFTTAQGEQTLELYRLDAKTKKYLVRRPEQAVAYEIEEYQGRQLLPDLKDLR